MLTLTVLSCGSTTKQQVHAQETFFLHSTPHHNSTEEVDEVAHLREDIANALRFHMEQVTSCSVAQMSWPCKLMRNKTNDTEKQTRLATVDLHESVRNLGASVQIDQAAPVSSFPAAVATAFSPDGSGDTRLASIMVGALMCSCAMVCIMLSTSEGSSSAKVPKVEEKNGGPIQSITVSHASSDSAEQAAPNDAFTVQSKSAVQQWACDAYQSKVLEILGEGADPEFLAHSLLMMHASDEQQHHPFDESSSTMPCSYTHNHVNNVLASVRSGSSHAYLSGCRLLDAVWRRVSIGPADQEECAAVSEESRMITIVD